MAFIQVGGFSCKSIVVSSFSWSIARFLWDDWVSCSLQYDSVHNLL